MLRKASRFARRATRRLAARANVAILARRPDGKFVFVKQYRKAAEAALVEVIAGGLEPGEDPMECARRETAEETGYRQMNAADWRGKCRRMVGRRGNA
ncbi:MAG: NUDIX hydrolase [Kiritimatiellae bacterium]|nr:NUDIX hydrolase [Kiritimatiellia bacterium]